MHYYCFSPDLLPPADCVFASPAADSAQSPSRWETVANPRCRPTAAGVGVLCSASGRKPLPLLTPENQFKPDPDLTNLGFFGSTPFGGCFGASCGEDNDLSWCKLAFFIFF
ncbi:unnamed protein product [Dibothriocephalus latus]|uniref:Uncharacterized protein n=1 Tax=Dibothriocephalus latus TaxID=60516 RepID=A0A3P7M2L0_DIBLA|nr:unnamed protein product [Dibothriocephalus latus]